MTIDQLRERKRQLLERKEEELRLKREGRGDSMALFMLEEELLDVNDHIRAIDPRRRHRGHRRTAAGEQAADRQQYLDWLGRDGEDNRAARREMRRAVADCDLYLTRRQQEVFDRWRGGETVTELAARLGVNKSTVSRTLAAARASIRRGLELDRRESGEALRLSMSDGSGASAVLACVTAKQAVYLYLYYGEGLSLREAAALTGVDHTVVMRGLRRGLEAVSRATGYREVVLDDLEVLGDLAFSLYQEGFDPPETARPAARGPDWGRRALGKAPRARRAQELRTITARAVRREPGEPGPLLRALGDRAGLGALLAALFREIKKAARRAAEGITARTFAAGEEKSGTELPYLEQQMGNLQRIWRLWGRTAATQNGIRRSTMHYINRSSGGHSAQASPGEKLEEVDECST